MPSIVTSYSPPPIQPSSSINATREAVASGSSDQGATVAAMAEQMLSQSTGYDRTARNLNDGISAAQVADANLEESQQLVERMRELATQAANGIYSNNQRTALQAEMSQLQGEFTQITQNSSFNGNNLLGENGTIAIQAGTGDNDTIGIPTTDLNSRLNSLNFFDIDLSTQAGASSALGILGESSSLVSATRAQYGTVQNQLESRIDVTFEQRDNSVEARGRLIDTDYAAATAELARKQILESAGLAMQSHANTSRTDALQLLGI